MPKKCIRIRGVGICVDTTAAAEYDILDHKITDDELDGIAWTLRETAFTQNDRAVGDVRIRLIRGYDVTYQVGREPQTTVITIGGFVFPDPENPTEKIIQKLGVVANIRGAFGV